MARRHGTLGLLLLCTSLTAGCGLISDGANAYVAPIGAIPATDVVVETNLQTALAQLETFSATQGTLTGYSASGFVPGASTTAGETSFDAPTPTEAVLAVFNDADRNCYGIVYVLGSSPTPVLGETGSGTYFFADLDAPLGTCSSASFAAESVAPSSWPAGDPSSSGFPSP